MGRKKRTGLPCEAFPGDNLPLDYKCPEGHDPIAARDAALTKRSEKNGSKKRQKQTHCPIDWRALAEMHQIQCTVEEIQAICGIELEILLWRCPIIFGETYPVWSARHREGGKMSLRRAMISKAIVDKDSSMQKWLSTHYLKMQEHVEVSGPAGGAIKLTFADIKHAPREQNQ